VDSRSRIFLGALIVTGFALRVAEIHEVAFSADEAQFIYFGAADSLADLWQLVSTRSPHPPANFAMLHFLLKVSWDPLWLRLPSVLAGTFLIWLAHRFGRALFGPAAGLAMAALVTFSPSMLELSRVCRNYAPGFVFLLLAFHFMVRYLQTDRRRPLAAFAVAAPIAGIWHYIFVVAFLALDLVVAVELLARRRTWRNWLAVALAHLPFAALMSLLYVTHVSHVPDHLVEFHQTSYEAMLSISAADLVGRFQQVWHYLELSAFADVFFGLSALGALCLLVNGERLALLVCTAPLVVAAAFSWAGQIPLGGTRHSAYLFPFLFALVASQVPEILDGYRRTASNLRRHLARVAPGLPGAQPAGGETAPNEGRARPVAKLGAAAVAIFGAAFVGASLLDYAEERTFNPFDSRTAGRELPVWYRVEDVARSFALIEERAGENDLVVLLGQGTYAARMHYRLTPRPGELDPDRMKKKPVFRYIVNGVSYYVLPGRGLISTAHLLGEAVDVVRSFYRLPAPDRVWTIRGSWEFSLANAFRREAPELPFDEDVERESNGLVFAVSLKSLEAFAALAEDDELKNSRRSAGSRRP
jgi:hypothetical protein